MKAVVAAFNQEKALVGSFSVIVKTDCETDGSFYSTTLFPLHCLPGKPADLPPAVLKILFMNNSVISTAIIVIDDDKIVSSWDFLDVNENKYTFWLTLNQN